MPAPSYALTLATANSADPAGDIITLIEARLTDAGWVYIEEVAFTQATVARVMRVWKCPGTQNAAGVDFFIGLIKNAAGGIYIAARAFEGYNVTNHTMQKPCISGAASHYPVGGWTWQARTMPASGYSAVAYGNGVFVAIQGQGGVEAARSQDGITWTATVMPSGQFWNGVVYGNGVFVAIRGGSGSAIYATSPDGITWTERVTMPVGSYAGITFGNGIFLAFTATTIAVTSSDGITWTERVKPSGTYTSVTYGAGLFVAVRTGATAVSSPDGITWTVRTMPVSTAWLSITYGNGMFVAVSSGSSTVSASSPDGITWTAAVLPSAANWTSVTYGNGIFLALNTASAATSVDGQTWTTRTILNSWTYVYGAPTGQFVAVTSSSNVAASWNYDPNPNWSAGNYDWLADGSTQPPVAEAISTAPLVVNTSYDVAVLASRSYVVIGAYLAGAGSIKTGWVLGLIDPIYQDDSALFPPLAVITTAGGTSTGGVSRSLRNIGVTANFSAACGPESLLLGAAFPSVIKEPASDLLRVARIVVGNQGGGFTTVGYRGWMFDAVAVAATSNVGLLGNTITIGATTYTVITVSAATAQFMSIGACAYCFDLTAGT